MISLPARASFAQTGGLTVVELRDAGHLPGLDQPQITFGLLARLLAEG